MRGSPGEGSVRALQLGDLCLIGQMSVTSKPTWKGGRFGEVMGMMASHSRHRAQKVQDKNNNEEITIVIIPTGPISQQQTQWCVKQV